MIKVIERPTITLKQLEVNYVEGFQNTVPEEYARDIGRYPYIQIGNLVIQTNDTTKIVLYNDQFIPKIEIFFKDPTLKLIDPLFPLDDEIISLFIQSSSELLMPVRMDFKITEFNIMKSNNDIDYVLTGLLNVDYLYYQTFSSDTLTSYNLLKFMASKAGLGFATNIDDTNDLMTWINMDCSHLEFIQDVVKHSYKSDDSFMLSYIDFYYNLNYVDIETALNEDITDMTGIFFAPNIFERNKEDVSNLFLTDHPDKSGSNNYISKFNLLNITTKVNLDIGYNNYVFYYDKNENTHYEILIDSITSPGLKNNLIMKGRVGEISNIQKNSYTYDILGVIDTDNVHPNYLYAKIQNQQNLDFLQKIRIKVTLSLINFNLYRFQKIELRLYKMKELTDDEVVINVDEKTVEGADKIDWEENKLNKRLSGEWLIIGINYTFNKFSGFSQEIILVKRELGFNDNDFDI